MTVEEAAKSIGKRVCYRQFADTIPEKGKIVDTFGPWAMVLIDGAVLPSELEPWCLTLSGGSQDEGMAPCAVCGGHDIVYMPESDTQTSATCMECGAEWVEAI